VSKRPRLVLMARRRNTSTSCVNRVPPPSAMCSGHRSLALSGRRDVSQIARVLQMTRKSVLKWIDKALQIGVKAGMKDTPHKPREAVITDDAKAWVVHLACAKPKELGYAAELWTRSALARHVRQQAVAAGYPFRR